ncbi:DUF397 domain-containing protein [Spirillospora sp. NPDC047279]|uniref:DUF397 domain-containing protein n=1 Tax=Spirillospora sp. NPDC047279 TaxID=3155478 RepID=UPI0033D7C0BC
MIAWRKSGKSADTGDCVELARHGESILVRDSRDRDDKILTLTPAQWGRLVTRIRDGELDGA